MTGESSPSPIVLQMEKCAQDLGNSTKAVSSAIAHLLGEVAQGNENYTGTGSAQWDGDQGRDGPLLPQREAPSAVTCLVVPALGSLSWPWTDRQAGSIGQWPVTILARGRQPWEGPVQPCASSCRGRALPLGNTPAPFSLGPWPTSRSQGLLRGRWLRPCAR